MYGFYFFDLTEKVEGLDTLYIASDDAIALRKYSLVDGAWASNGTIGADTDDYRGLTASVSEGVVTLYATRRNSELVALTDKTGYNGDFAGDPTVIAKAESNTVFRGVAFAPTAAAENQAPVVTLNGGDVSYTENAAATVLASAATVTDADSANFDTGTLTVEFGANGTADDRLAIRNEGTASGQIGVSGSNVTFGGTTIGSFTGGTGTAPLVVTFNANATPGAAQALVRNITFANVSENPSTASRSVNFTLTDGDGGTSTTVSRTVTVAAVNDAPVVTTSTGTTSYTENDSGVAIDNLLTVSDVDSATLSGATVAITGNFAGTEDALAFADQSGITGVYDETTGVLTLSGSASVADYQAALRSVTYFNSSENPSTVTRTITFTVNDGALNSAAATKAVSVAAVNDAPAVTAPGSVSTNEDTNFVFTSANAISVSDVDAAQLTVTLTATNGTLTLGGTAGLTVSGNGTATVALSGTISALNAGLDGTTFTPTANFNGPASVQVSATDNGETGTGGPLSDSKTVNVSVISVNDAPAGASFTVTTDEDEPYTFAVSDFSFTDPNDTPANAFAGIVIGSLPTAGTLTNNGTAVTSGQFVSAADLAAGLLVFTPNEKENGSAYASFTFQVRDDGGGSNTDLAARTATINVTAVNDDPSVTLSQQTITVTAGTAFALPGFATFAAGGGADELGQTVQAYNATATNSTLFAIAPAIDTAGRLTFTASGTTGTTTVTVTVTDSEGATSAQVQFSVTVETVPVVPSPQPPVNVAVDPTARFIAAGADAGSNGTVALFDARTGAPLVSFQPFGNYAGGVAVALGDLTGDGTAELVVATRGSIGLIAVYDLATGATLVSPVRPFANRNTGLQITTADVDGDGVHDLVFSPERGAPTVAAFSFTKAQFVSVVDPLPGANLNFQLAAGNVTGDGRAELILSANGAVAVFDAAGPLASLFTVAPGFGGEMALAVGDTDGDGRREIVVALQAPGADTAVAAFTAQGALVWNLFADTGAGIRRDGTNRPAVQTAPRLAVADVTGDQIADVLLGSQPGMGTSRVSVFDGATRQQVRSDLAFTDTLGLFTDAG